MRLMLLLILPLFLAACEDGIPEDFIETLPADHLEALLDSGEVKGSLNPFPLVNRPGYKQVNELAYLRDDERVLVSKSCGRILVYPIRHMHVEVVNEALHGVYMVVSYCPITRSALSWNRIIHGDTLLLTASGYLFRENLMPLDLGSGSIFLQMQSRGLVGSFAGQQAEMLPLLVLPWSLVKENFPESGVFEAPTKKSAATEPPGEVLGILSRDRVELFSPALFGEDLVLFETQVNPGGRVVVAGSADQGFMTAFLTGYEMEVVQDAFPIIMRDETGSLWNIFGEAVSGERGGERLNSPPHYHAAEWAWHAHFSAVYFHEAER